MKTATFSTKTLWTGVSSGKRASYRALVLMETNTDKNSLNFVSDYSSVSLIKSSFFHVKVTNTKFRLVSGNYHVPAIWHNQLVHYSAISLQSNTSLQNISTATLVDTCFMMLENLLLFQSFQQLLNLKIFSFLSEK